MRKQPRASLETNKMRSLSFCPSAAGAICPHTRNGARPSRAPHHTQATHDFNISSALDSNTKFSKHDSAGAYLLLLSPGIYTHTHTHASTNVDDKKKRLMTKTYFTPSIPRVLNCRRSFSLKCNCDVLPRFLLQPHTYTPLKSGPSTAAPPCRRTAAASTAPKAAQA